MIGCFCAGCSFISIVLPGFKDPYSREEQTNFGKWYVYAGVLFVE